MLGKALKSKSVWTQIISFAAMAATMFGFEVSAEDQAKILAAVVGVTNVVGIIMRLITTKPIAEK